MNTEQKNGNIFTHKKAMVNFKIYGVTDWTTSNCSTSITQYLKK